MKTRREIHITTTPKTKAIATDTNIAIITLRALLLLSRSVNSSEGFALILKRASMNVAPSRSNTSETVVEVGMPRVLNISSTTTSATITARKIVIISANE